MRPDPRITRTFPKWKRKPNPKRAAQHLAFIRLLPCMICGSRPAQAAHIRRATDGGIGTKPSDKFTLPLCVDHHDEQHTTGELTFWSFYRIDPVDQALRLWTVSGDLEAGERIVFRARQAIILKEKSR
jgi:hypothetical protein